MTVEKLASSTRTLIVAAWLLTLAVAIYQRWVREQHSALEYAFYYTFGFALAWAAARFVNYHDAPANWTRLLLDVVFSLLVVVKMTRPTGWDFTVMFLWLLVPLIEILVLVVAGASRLLR